MSTLSDQVIDTFPANGDVGVPTKSQISITLSGTDYDNDSLINNLFVEGPDTDQYIGPGGLIQNYPVNVSQGPIEDFLKSPGYQGIAEGTTEITVVGSDTKITFSPSLPLAPLVEYTVHLTNVLALDGVTPIDGYVTFSFTAGSGSIEEIPASISSSPLSSATPFTSANDIFSVLSSNPEDRAVEVDSALKTITVTFTKEIDPLSVDDSMISVISTLVSDHPALSGKVLGTLAKTIQVIGNKIVIGI